MKQITILYLQGCPYCAKARQALAELAQENDAYAAIEAEWIEENRQPEYAAQHGYDYWYVPSIFYQDRKLYEADPAQDYDGIKKSIKAALDLVCAE